MRRKVLKIIKVERTAVDTCTRVPNTLVQWSLLKSDVIKEAGGGGVRDKEQ